MKDFIILKKFLISSLFLVVVLFFLPKIALAAISLDELPGYFDGWAWVGNASDDQAHFGFASLCNQTEGLCENSNYKLILNKAGVLENRYVPVDGYLWFGDYDPADLNLDKYNLGWMDFSLQENPPERPAQYECGYPNEPGGNRAFYDLEENSLVGWARILSLKQEGELSGSDDWGWVSLCGKDGSGAFRYRVSYDQLYKKLRGWVWSAGGSIGGAQPGYSNDVGLGWIEFNPQSTLETYYYIQTFYGDVYSTEGIVGESPNTSGDWGATFLILSGGQIIDFSSARGGVRKCPPACEEGFECNQGYCVQVGTTLDDWMIEDYEQIYLPTQDRGYYNLLGELDVEGLIDYDQISHKNKYGHLVDESVDIKTTLENGGNISLAGRVIYINGNLVLDKNDLIFLNSLGSLGDGTIIVNGDLNLGVNIYNQQAANLSLTRELASAAWIIQGNLNIDPLAEDLAGAFFVIGNGTESSGVVSTGDSNRPLEVKGLVMAKMFNFQRKSPFGASEKVIYDGRVVVNPPPGLEDFSAILPYFISRSK